MTSAGLSLQNKKQQQKQFLGDQKGISNNLLCKVNKTVTFP